MKEITAIIERGKDGLYAIYVENIPGLIGSGLTENEAKKDFIEVKEEQAEYYYERHGEKPWWSDATVTYHYNIEAF